MLSIIGESLPLAVGVAISPIPIIATILMLLSPNAKRTSAGFLIGWLGGIIVATTVFVLLSGVLPDRQEGSASPVSAIIRVVLGAALVFLAVRQWNTRPTGDDDAQLPGWMHAIDSMTAGRAIVLAFALAAVNPKNLLLAASAGLLISDADSGWETTVSLLVFTAIAGSSVLVPVLGYAIAGARLAAALDTLRQWLVRNNAAIMSVVLLLLGVSVLGKALAAV